LIGTWHFFIHSVLGIIFYGTGLAEFDGTNCMVYDISNSGLHDNKVHTISIDESDTK